MSLDKSGMASVFVSIVLIEMAMIGALATAQTDQGLIGLEGASGQR